MKKILCAFLAVWGIALSAMEFTDGKILRISVGTATYDNIETAVSPSATSRGLMFRKSLPEGSGMLFVFPREEVRHFWMKNTLIPLDILFLDAKWQVISAFLMVPQPPRQLFESEFFYERRLATYSSRKPAQYALELPAGQIEKAGIKPGMTVRILEK